MTDEAPPDQRYSRQQSSPPEADLDAALWPAPGHPSFDHPSFDQPVSDQPAPEMIQSADRIPARQARRVAPPSKPSARERIRSERARQARRRRRIRATATSIGVVVFMAAGAAVSLVVLNVGHHPVPPRTGYAGPFAPVTLNLDNSVTMAKPGVTTPVLDVYEDFRCQACAAFENASGSMIQRLAQQGRIAVIYHPFTAVSGQPQQASSIRAWAAGKCAPANRWGRYHNALYASQPSAAAANGFTPSTLVQLGRDVGITGRGFARCVQSQQYAAQDAPLSDQIINSGIGTAPILKLNGRVLNVHQATAELRQRILSAR